MASRAIARPAISTSGIRRPGRAIVNNILMWPAIVCVVAAYIPGDIKRVLKHPMLVGIEAVGVRRTSSPTAISARSFCSARSWRGRCIDRITLKHRSDPGAPEFPARRTRQRRHGGGRRDAALLGAGFLVPSVRHRRAGLREIERVHTKRHQAADRSRHPRSQGRRADRLPDLLSRAHRASGRQVLRRHPGRRLRSAW